MTLPTLENVAKDLTAWRQSRSKRGPIPNELRTKISALSSRYRVSDITTALGINTAQIKTFSRTPQKISKAPIKFIRLNQPPLLGKIDCQLKRPDGTLLECALDPNTLSKLIGDFLCLR